MIQDDNSADQADLRTDESTQTTMPPGCLFQSQRSCPRCSPQTDHGMEVHEEKRGDQEMNVIFMLAIAIWLIVLWNEIRLLEKKIDKLLKKEAK